MAGVRDTLSLSEVLLGRERLGPYAIESLLGSGGMGLVLRARAADGSLVALKAIRPDVVTRGLRERFGREAAIRIEHPNVVRTLDSGTDDGVPYIAFELLEGESFERRLERETRIAPAALVPILRQVCAGLEAAHAHNVIHRDLKPGNVFLCRDGQVKILDFGIALVTTEARITNTASLVGTMAYLSPEQARGTREVDARTDIWAAGVLAYEALSGRLPIEREPAIAMLVAIIQEPHEPLAEVAPHLSPDLVAIVERCLRKQPGDRWPSARALNGALGLRTHTTDATMFGPRPPAPPRHSLPPGESRVVVAMLARAVGEAEAVELAVRARGGIAVPLLGGDVVGIFGTLGWQGDEVRRAVSAAIAVRHLAASVGVASGRARADATGIAGEALRAAEHGCAAALEGVAVDAVSARSLDAGFFTQAGPEGLVEVLGERGEEAALEEADVPPLIGREAELRTLKEVIERTCSGPSVVFLSGPAGIGKTRLRREAERLYKERFPGAVVLKARSELSAREVSYGLFAGALRRHARRGAVERGWPPLRPDAPPLVQRQAVLALARDAIDDADAAQRCAEALAALLSVPWGRATRLAEASTDPQLMIDRSRVALVDYLAGLVTRGPIALLLDDLQLADTASIVLLEDLPSVLAGSPIFVAVTVRAQTSEALPAIPGAVAMQLDGLDEDEVGQLAARAAGGPLAPPLVSLLAERTEGNPLFVEQIAVALRERGASLRSTGAGRLPLPLTVEAAIQARLDDLPEAAREVCRLASLLGRPVHLDELIALGAPEATSHVALLVSRGLMKAQGGGGGSGVHELRFRSSLIAAVAYRMIAPELRAELHRRAATVLLTEPGHDAAEVALHLERGERPTEAAESYADAALEAVERGDADRVLRCSALALELGVREERRFALHVARADTHRFLRRPVEQTAEVARALALAGTAAERAYVLTEQVSLAVFFRESAEALALSELAVAEADRSEDVDRRVLARVIRARALAMGGEPERASQELLDARLLAADCGVHTRAQLAATAALAAAIRGDLGGALDGFVEAARLYRSRGDLRRAAAIESNLADSYNRIGAFDAAEGALLESLAASRRVGARQYEGYVLANLGHARAQLGRIDEALETLAEAEAVSRQSSDARLAAWVRFYRARALLAAGRAKEALNEAVEALGEARAVKERALSASINALSARASLAAGQLRTALACSERALAERDALGGGAEDEGEIFVARVEALRAAGRTEEAEQIRLRGAARVRDLAGRIGHPDWRARFVDGPEAHRALLA